MIKYFLWSAIIALIGYFVFIPVYSYWGAAYMTLAVEWLIVIFAWRVIKKNIDVKLNFKVLYKSIIAGVFSFFVAWNLRAYNIVLIFSLSLFLYLIFLTWFRTVSKENLKKIFLNR